MDAVLFARAAGARAGQAVDGAAEAAGSAANGSSAASRSDGGGSGELAHTTAGCATVLRAGAGGRHYAAGAGRRGASAVRGRKAEGGRHARDDVSGAHRGWAAAGELEQCGRSAARGGGSDSRAAAWRNL